jgi:hypothetical protein
VGIDGAGPLLATSRNARFTFLMSPTFEQRGSPLTEDVDVFHEREIVWVRGGPDDYPYLRESITKAGTRARPLRSLGESVVAYATLLPDAPSITPGMFLRRVWTFQSGRDGRLSPMQGVKPQSIAAGRRSDRI